MAVQRAGLATASGGIVAQAAQGAQGGTDLIDLQYEGRSLGLMHHELGCIALCIVCRLLKSKSCIELSRRSQPLRHRRTTLSHNSRYDT